MESELTINIGGFPPLSARGCEQELTPISEGEFHRDINGDLIYLGQDTHTKYKSTSSGRPSHLTKTSSMNKHKKRSFKLYRGQGRP